MPEGRRGGYCLKLDVPVQANWSACPLASDPFSSAWDDTVPLISSLAYHHNPKRQEEPLAQEEQEVIPIPLGGNMLQDLP